MIRNVLIAGFLLGAAAGFAQRPVPKPRVEPKEKGASVEFKRVDKKAEPIKADKKMDKWDRGQQKDGFNKAANGEPVERKSEPVKRASTGTTEKRDKWDRGNQKDGFNRAAQGEPASVREGKGGQSQSSSKGSATTAAAPAPRPKF